jgi:uncharacterized protein (DUF2225 family)
MVFYVSTIPLTISKFYAIIKIRKEKIMAIDVSEVKRRLHALLNDSNLVNEYIRQYGPTIEIKHIKAIKDEKMKALAVSSESGNGNDPVFEIRLTCPVCNRENIICYELRAKSQLISKNKFLVPRYEGASGYRTVDYSTLSVTVCPRCLFASPDKKDWSRQDDDMKSQLPGNVIMTLQERIGERRAILKNIPDVEGYFKRPRVLNAIIASYNLAKARAGVEAFYEQPYSYFKLGAYTLRTAKIIKDSGGDNREIFREALGYMEETFRTSNCPSEEIEMQSIYSIIALCLKLEDQKKANSYLGVFTNLYNDRINDMKDNSKLNTIIISKWNDRAKQLWEDRDMPDLFKNE